MLGTRGAIDISVAYHSADGAARLVVGADSSLLSEPECYYDSHVTIVEDWLRAISDGTAPGVPIASAAADVAVVVAAQRSIELGGAEVAVEAL